MWIAYLTYQFLWINFVSLLTKLVKILTTTFGEATFHRVVWQLRLQSGR